MPSPEYEGAIDTVALDRAKEQQILQEEIYSILRQVMQEVISAMETNKPTNSLHEGYAVILEELDEVKAEVWKNPRKHPDRTVLARKELIQTAAMCIRTIHDVCDR